MNSFGKARFVAQIFFEMQLIYFLEGEITLRGIELYVLTT